MITPLHCFPILRILSEPQRDEFGALMQRIATHKNFDLVYFGEGRRTLPGQLPQDVIHLISGHIAELFFFRQDILDTLLSARRSFFVYATPKAYNDDGGVMGGQFHLDRGAIMLAQSRLSEGMNGEWPGVCPFLHELGHMLDFFDARTGGYKRNNLGLLPGLSPEDGTLYTAKARELFLRGKREEMSRYAALKAAPQNLRGALPAPLGHPYVFQNDTEFCAGYLEMWLRNPHSFAETCPNLFAGYAELLRWDPRNAWLRDFDFYVQQNQKFYAGSEALWESRLNLQV